MSAALRYCGECVNVLCSRSLTSLQCDRCAEKSRKRPCLPNDSRTCTACYGQKVSCTWSGLRANGEILAKHKVIARFNGSGFSIVNRGSWDWDEIYASILKATQYLIQNPVYIVHLQQLVGRTSDCLEPGAHSTRFPPAAVKYLNAKQPSALKHLPTDIPRRTEDVSPPSHSPSDARGRAPTRGISPSASPLHGSGAKPGRTRQHAFVQVPRTHHHRSVPPPLSRSVDSTSGQASPGAPLIAKSASSGAVPSSFSFAHTAASVEAMLSKYNEVHRPLHSSYGPAHSQSPAPSQSQSPATSQLHSRGSSTSRRSSRQNVRFDITQPPQSTSAAVTSDNGQARRPRPQKRKRLEPEI